MVKRRGLKRLGLTGAVCGLVAFVGCSRGETDGAGEETPRVSVRTAMVERSDFPVVVALSGTLEGERQSVLLARLQTHVRSVAVRVGDRVKKGEILLRLDPEGSGSQYRQTEALMRDAERLVQRMQSLYQEGAVSERELDVATTNYQVAQANFEAARQAVQIESPLDGIVTDLYVRSGDEVSPGLALVAVAYVEALRLVLDVPTAQKEQLAVGQPVRVTDPFDSAVAMQGVVQSVATAADRRTRTFEVECRFATPAPGFAPGTFVTAEVTVATLSGALLIPNEALIYRGGRALTYAVQGDSAILVPLEVRATRGPQTAVAGELQEGQRVVVTGQKNLTPGALVHEVGT